MTESFYATRISIERERADDGEGPWIVGANLPALQAGSVHTTAVSLNALGEAGLSQFGFNQDQAVRYHITTALQHRQALAEQVLAAYVSWELAWADRFDDVLSGGQKAVLARGTEGEALLNDGADIADARVALAALRMLGQDPAGLIPTAQRIIDGARTTICQPELDGAGQFSFLAAASILGTHLPCPSQLPAVWDEAVATLRQGIAAHAAGDLGWVASLLLVMEEAREHHWPEDAGKRSVVRDLLAQVLAIFTVTDQNLLAPGDWATVQKLGHLTDTPIEVPTFARQRLMALAQAGGGATVRQVGLGAQAGMVLGDARILGLNPALPKGFPDGMGPVERLSVFAAQGQPWNDGTEQLIKQVITDGDPQVLFELVGPYLLAAGQKACQSAGVAAVSEALPRAVQGPTAAYRFGYLAQSLRLVQQCSGTAPAGLSDTLLALAEATAHPDGSELSLAHWWNAVATQCALAPDEAPVGQTAWERTQSYISENGGAISAAGYVSVTATHEVLTLVTTTTAQCQDRGIMG
ncbi:MAG: hypothetical protein LBV00_12045 [Propionibacteriaceae bacterium]|nr:hypothetical protein [Propionibacteriaceae bacterium]